MRKLNNQIVKTFAQCYTESYGKNVEYESGLAFLQIWAHPSESTHVGFFLKFIFADVSDFICISIHSQCRDDPPEDLSIRILITMYCDCSLTCLLN